MGIDLNYAPLPPYDYGKSSQPPLSREAFLQQAAIALAARRAGDSGGFDEAHIVRLSLALWNALQEVKP